MNKYLKTITFYKGLAFGNCNPVIKLFPPIYSHSHVQRLRGREKIIFPPKFGIQLSKKRQRHILSSWKKVTSVKQIKCLIRPNYLML